MMGEISDRQSACAFFGGIGAAVAIAAACLFCQGCFYKGGKVIDGTNLAVGMTIPGTEWQINVLDYVGGMRVAGNDQTSIVVTNEVAETNEYFGIIRTSRRTKMTASIEPCEDAATNEFSGAANP